MKNNLQVDPEVIGPEEAREMLKNLVPQYRPPDSHYVELFADVMRRGKWVPTYETIKIDVRPGTVARLVDGRRRLLAIIESGAEIEFLVMRGPFELFDPAEEN